MKESNFKKYLKNLLKEELEEGGYWGQGTSTQGAVSFHGTFYGFGGEKQLATEPVPAVKKLKKQRDAEAAQNIEDQMKINRGYPAPQSVSGFPGGESRSGIGFGVRKPNTLSQIGLSADELDKLDINNPEKQYWGFRDSDVPEKLDENALNERTLYHGTLNQHLDSVKKYGLTGELGDFVKDAYGINFDEEDWENELEGITFAADLSNIDAAVGAMRYHVGKKLNKHLTDVTEEDLREHGMLVIIRDIDEPKQIKYPEDIEDDQWYHRPKGDQNYYGAYPTTVEPGDWFIKGGSGIDDVLVGNKMMQFLRRVDGLKDIDSDKRRKLIKLAVMHHGPEKREMIIQKVKSLSGTELYNMLRTYEKAFTESENLEEQLGATGIGPQRGAASDQNYRNLPGYPRPNAIVKSVDYVPDIEGDKDGDGEEDVYLTDSEYVNDVLRLNGIDVKPGQMKRLMYGELEESKSDNGHQKIKTAIEKYLYKNDQTGLEKNIKDILSARTKPQFKKLLSVDSKRHPWAWRFIDFSSKEQLEKILGKKVNDDGKIHKLGKGTLNPKDNLSSWTVNPRSLLYSEFFSVVKETKYLVLFKASTKENQFFLNPDGYGKELGLKPGYALERETLGVGPIEYEAAVYQMPKEKRSLEGKAMDLINTLSPLDDIDWTEEYYFPDLDLQESTDPKFSLASVFSMEENYVSPSYGPEPDKGIERYKQGQWLDTPTADTDPTKYIMNFVDHSEGHAGLKPADESPGAQTYGQVGYPKNFVPDDWEQRSEKTKVEEQVSAGELKEIFKSIAAELILNERIGGSRTKKGRKVPGKYLKGLKTGGEYGSKAAMKREIDKFAGTDKYKKDWKADHTPSGERIKTKESEATKKYREKFGSKKEQVGIEEDIDVALKNKSKDSGIPVSILRQVYNRGKAAWNSGHRPGTSQDQWAMGRVNSFITGSGGSRKADKDLWARAKKSKTKKEAYTGIDEPTGKGEPKGGSAAFEKNHEQVTKLDKNHRPKGPKEL